MKNRMEYWNDRVADRCDDLRGKYGKRVDWSLWGMAALVVWLRATGVWARVGDYASNFEWRRETQRAFDYGKQVVDGFLDWIAS